MGKKEQKIMAKGRDNSGALITNDKKGNEKAPDWRGPCKVNG